MDANDYQKQAARTANDIIPESILINVALGLTGEAGEFADHIKKWRFHNHDLDQKHLEKELGDILWYVARACTFFNISLSDVMQQNIDKLWKRFPEGFNSEASKTRADVEVLK